MSDPYRATRLVMFFAMLVATIVVLAVALGVCRGGQ